MSLVNPSCVVSMMSHEVYRIREKLPIHVTWSVSPTLFVYSNYLWKCTVKNILSQQSFCDLTPPRLVVQVNPSCVVSITTTKVCQRGKNFSFAITWSIIPTLFLKLLFIKVRLEKPWEKLFVKARGLFVVVKANPSSVVSMTSKYQFRVGCKSLFLKNTDLFAQDTEPRS